MSWKKRLISWAGAVLIRFLGATWRIQIVDAAYLDEAREHSPNVVFAIWHGRLFPMAYTHRNLAIHVLASAHKDGELMGQTIRRLGFGHVRGSSTRGGARAVREMKKKLEAGLDVGFTVDGPRGPAFRVKPGPLEVAKVTGAAIVPLTASSRRRKVFSSWDAFELPLPFTRVTVRYAPPIIVPGDADASTIEKKRLELETALQEITKTNDESFRS